MALDKIESITDVGPLGFDFQSYVGFDIAGPDDAAFLVGRPVFGDVPGNSSLFSVDLETGAATVVGAIGDGTRSFDGFSIVPEGFVIEPEEPGSGLQNPFTPGTNESFLENLYIDLLGRNHDEVGFNAYVGALANATPRDEIADSFLHSPEYFGRRVQDLYRDHLGRDADAESLGSYLASLLDGRSLDDVRTEILTSVEYSRLHPTDEDFVAALYQELLGRAPGRKKSLPMLARAAATSSTRSCPARNSLASRSPISTRTFSNARSTKKA